MGPCSKVMPGDEKTGEGAVRLVACTIQEEITKVEWGKQIHYYVKSGPFPVSYHEGVVTFFQTKTGGTKIVWHCEYTPYCGMGFFINNLIPFSFNWMLSHLDKKVKNDMRCHKQ